MCSMMPTIVDGLAEPVVERLAERVRVLREQFLRERLGDDRLRDESQSALLRSAAMISLRFERAARDQLDAERRDALLVDVELVGPRSVSGSISPGFAW